jgi:hypothetical protein
MVFLNSSILIQNLLSTDINRIGLLPIPSSFNALNTPLYVSVDAQATNYDP